MPHRTKTDYRSLLHAVRLADQVLFWPVVALVAWGELAPPSELGFAGLLAHIDDKLLHFSAYFLMGGMAGAALRRRRPVYWAVLGLIGLGGGLEILQGFVGRDMSGGDELANALGTILGAALVRPVVESLRRRFPNR